VTEFQLFTVDLTRLVRNWPQHLVFQMVLGPTTLSCCHPCLCLTEFSSSASGEQQR